MCGLNSDRYNEVQGCARCQVWICYKDEFIYWYTEYYKCSCDNDCGAIKSREVYGFVSPKEIAAYPEKAAAACADRDDVIKSRKAELIGQLLPVLHEAFAALPTFSEDDGKKPVEHATELLDTIRTTTDKDAAKAALDELRRLLCDHVSMIEYFPVKYEKLHNVIRKLSEENTNPYYSNEIISPEVADECARAQSAYDNEQAREAVYTAANTACEKIRDLYRTALTTYEQRRWELRRWRVWNTVSGLFVRAA